MGFLSPRFALIEHRYQCNAILHKHFQHLIEFPLFIFEALARKLFPSHIWLSTSFGIRQSSSMFSEFWDLNSISSFNCTSLEHCPLNIQTYLHWLIWLQMNGAVGSIRQPRDQTQPNLRVSGCVWTVSWLGLTTDASSADGQAVCADRQGVCADRQGGWVRGVAAVLLPEPIGEPDAEKQSSARRAGGTSRLQSRLTHFHGRHMLLLASQLPPGNSPHGTATTDTDLALQPWKYGLEWNWVLLHWSAWAYNKYRNSLKK